mmetsp:Transcript_23972/g.56954  ORF Transcript_23972/g.56954 Transcript_23972/m.56954 type:complete len:279 (-) Transcript_23972:690-1526(-)
MLDVSLPPLPPGVEDSAVRARAELLALQHMPPPPALFASERELAVYEATNEDLQARCEALKAQVGAWGHEKARLTEAARCAREEREAMVSALAEVVRKVGAERDELQAELARVHRRGGTGGGGEQGAAATPAAEAGALSLVQRLVPLGAEVRALAAERAALLHGLGSPAAIAAAQGAPGDGGEGADELAAAVKLVASAGGTLSAERLRLQLDAAQVIEKKKKKKKGDAVGDGAVRAAGRGARVRGGGGADCSGLLPQREGCGREAGDRRCDRRGRIRT